MTQDMADCRRTGDGDVSIRIGKEHAEWFDADRIAETPKRDGSLPANVGHGIGKAMLNLLDCVTADAVNPHG